MKAAEARALLKLIEQESVVTISIPTNDEAKIKAAISLAKTRSTLVGRLNYSSQLSDSGLVTHLTISLVRHAPSFQVAFPLANLETKETNND